MVIIKLDQHWKSVLLSQLWTFPDLQTGKSWSCHPMQTPANSWAAPFPTDTHLKDFQTVLFSHHFTRQTKIYRWSKGRFRPSKTCLKLNPETNQFRVLLLCSENQLMKLLLIKNTWNQVQPAISLSPSILWFSMFSGQYFCRVLQFKQKFSFLALLSQFLFVGCEEKGIILEIKLRALRM